MAKKKKKSASKTTKPAHKRREEEVIVALSAPASSSGLRRKNRNSVTASPSKYLSSPLNDVDIERVEVEECYEDDLEEEDLNSEDDEDGPHSDFKFFHSRATVHAGMENVSKTGMLSSATLRLTENLPADVPLAEEGGLHCQNFDLVGGKFLDPNRGSGVGLASTLTSNARNGGGRGFEGPHARVSALPSSGKEVASLGSPLVSGEAMNSNLKSCTQPVCQKSSVRSGAPNAAMLNTYHEASGRATCSIGPSLNEGGQ